MRLGIDVNSNGDYEDVWSFGSFPWYVRLIIRLIMIALSVLLRRKGILAQDKSPRKGGGNK
jgi:hypothetical protein